MKLTYGKSWFRAKRQITQVWEIERARSAHENRLPYAVICQKEEMLLFFAEFNDQYIGVGFYDENKREYTTYQFQEKKTGKLFLSMAVHREYKERSQQVAIGTTYYFKEIGHVLIEKSDFVNATITKTESILNVEPNWEPYPDFGRYAGVSQLERDLRDLD